MRLLGIQHIDKFIKKHPKTKSALLRWKKIIESGQFKNFVELRKTLPTADQVSNKTVFNVGGNKVRTITLIEYGIAQVIITDVLTHAEYDRDKWKD